MLFSPFHSNYGQANANTARVIAKHPDRFIGFASVHAQRDQGRIGQIIAKAVTQWGFCGIKIHRHEAPATHEICEVVRCFRPPLLYNVAGI